MTELTPMLEFAQAFAQDSAQGTAQAATDYLTSILDRLAVFGEVGSRWKPPHMPFVD